MCETLLQTHFRFYVEKHKMFSSGHSNEGEEYGTVQKRKSLIHVTEWLKKSRTFSILISRKTTKLFQKSRF
jgi:hypothetical protein